MAKGNLILGTLRGKLGDVVAYRSLGKQMARVRVRNVKNPKTQLQTLQRIVLACAAKTVAVLEPIVNHSWQSTAYGAASKRYARKQIMKVLREQMVAAYNDETRQTSAQQVGCFPTFASGAAVAAYPISQGSLPSIATELVGAGSGGRFGGSLPNMPEITAELTAEQFFSALGVDVNTQLTFVFLTPKLITAEGETPAFYNADLRVARINLAAGAGSTPLFVAGEGEDVFVFNTAALDLERSTLYDKVLFDTVAGCIVYQYTTAQGAVDNPVCAFSVIASKYVDGAWQRSSQRLSVGYPLAPSAALARQPYAAFNYFEDLMDAQVELDAVAEDRYLNKEKN